MPKVEEYFLTALCKTPTMHTATTSKILLTLLRLLLSSSSNIEDLEKLKQIAAAHSFDLDQTTGTKVTASKRVAFVIDYSGYFKDANTFSQEMFQLYFQVPCPVQRSDLLLRTFRRSFKTTSMMWISLLSLLSTALLSLNYQLPSKVAIKPRLKQ